MVDEQAFSSVSSNLFRKNNEQKSEIENLTLQPSEKLDFFHNNLSPKDNSALGSFQPEVVIEEQKSEEVESPGTPRQRTPKILKKRKRYTNTEM